MKVCDLDVAKELHELCKEKGIEMPGSDFYYVQNSTQGEEEWILCKKLIDNKFISLIIGFLISPFSNNVKTYTLDEILEWLPERVYTPDKFYFRKALFDDSICYEDPDRIVFDLVNFKINDTTNLATAACKLAIWLIREEYIK